MHDYFVGPEVIFTTPQHDSSGSVVTAEVVVEGLTPSVRIAGAEATLDAADFDAAEAYWTEVLADDPRDLNKPLVAMLLTALDDDASWETGLPAGGEPLVTLSARASGSSSSAGTCFW